MNNTHRKTLKDIFTAPIGGSIEWRRIEALFTACGAVTIEGNGSRERFELADVLATFHRPHPEKDAKRYQVRDARDFLMKVGVKP